MTTVSGPGRRGATLVVGLAPSRPVGELERPLEGSASLRRIARLARVTPDDVLRELVTTNVVREFPGRAGPTRAQVVGGAARVAQLVRQQRYSRVIVLGRSVEMALKLRQPFFEWRVAPVELASASVAVSPHPSGRSYWWNSEANVRAASRFWEEAYADAVALRCTT